MTGLSHDLRLAQSLLADAPETARADISPQDMHDARRRVGELEKEIAKLTDHIADDRVILSHLRAVMTRLRNPGFATPHRALVLSHLEDAECRILRELSAPET